MEGYVEGSRQTSKSIRIVLYPIAQRQCQCIARVPRSERPRQDRKARLVDEPCPFHIQGILHKDVLFDLRYNGNRIGTVAEYLLICGESPVEFRTAKYVRLATST